MIRNFTLALCLLCWVSASTPLVSGQSLGSVPGPGDGRWVIDHARVIPDFAKAQLEELCQEIKNFKNSELVILTVPDIGDADPDQFAIDYFNKWKIGNATDNNGLLVFAALAQRRAYISIGDGLKSKANFKKCEQITRDVMVARFKRNDSAGAMFGGAYAAARDILGHADLANRLERETNDERRLRKSTSPDRKKFFLWLAGGGVLGIGGICFLMARYKVRYGKRNCEKCMTEMLMLDEGEDDAYLDPPEVTEERIGSVDYDVWACMECDHVLKYRYGRFLTRYSKCPRCRYKTRSKITRTIQAATTSRGGRVRVTEDCANCVYTRTYTYSTPKLPKKSSSSYSGSSGGWSGGGGGFSGGGGGGSSSGGGGASW